MGTRDTSRTINNGMELKIIPFRDVEASIHEAREQWREPDKFNTHLHSYNEISAVVPETPELLHIKPSAWPSRYSQWVGMIMDIQGVRNWHVFELSRYFTTQILELFNVWAVIGRLNEAMLDDLVEMFPSNTVSGYETRSVFDGQEWFMRLDYCSTKDGKDGKAPVKSVRDVLQHLCTSTRVRASILETLHEDPESEGVKLFIVPFNSSMDPSHEYRIFCPPPKAGIAAISQYRWTSPLPLSDPVEATQYAHRIYEGAQIIHSLIMTHVEDLGIRGSVLIQTLEEQGFTFDMLMGPIGGPQLVEINHFGAMSGCGSSLFQWIEDARNLYGLEEKVQVRIAL